MLNFSILEIKLIIFENISKNRFMLLDNNFIYYFSKVNIKGKGEYFPFNINYKK